LKFILMYKDSSKVDEFLLRFVVLGQIYLGTIFFSPTKY